MDRIFKTSFFILALLAVIFGFWQISQNIKITLAEDKNQPGAESENLFDQARLKVLDTDEDGLSDWLELNTYKTSPYLADSDSDGVSDSDEIKAGSDPNCPPGRDCGSAGLLAPGAGAEASVNEQVAAEEAATATPDEIRELLRQGGVSEEDLTGATDEDLQKLFEEIVGQVQAGDSSNSLPQQ